MIFIFSKSKHLDLEAFDERRMLNPVIDPNRMEDHLAAVHWICTATM